TYQDLSNGRCARVKFTSSSSEVVGGGSAASSTALFIAGRFGGGVSSVWSCWSLNTVTERLPVAEYSSEYVRFRGAFSNSTATVVESTRCASFPGRRFLYAPSELTNSRYSSSRTASRGSRK